MAASVDEIEELQDGSEIHRPYSRKHHEDCGQSERSDIGDLWHDAVPLAVVTFLTVDGHADPQGRCHDADAVQQNDDPIDDGWDQDFVGFVVESRKQRNDRKNQECTEAPDDRPIGPGGVQGSIGPTRPLGGRLSSILRTR